jgi:hypothetical protein
MLLFCELPAIAGVSEIRFDYIEDLDKSQQTHADASVPKSVGEFGTPDNRQAAGAEL